MLSYRETNPRRLSYGIAAVFTVLAVVFGLSAAAMFWMQRVIERAQREVIAQQAIIDELRQTLSAVKDAETGQRGFLLTGEEAYLRVNLEAKPEIRKDFANLEACVRAGTLPPGPITEYRELATAKLRELDETIDVRRTRGFDAAAAIVRNNSGQQIMDRMRNLTDQMVRECDGVMAEKRTTLKTLSSAVELLLAVVVLLNFGSLAWAYRRIRREIDLRAAAALEAQRQRELFRTTLASIGDGVIVTDATGRITFINAMAEKLCGWEAGSAVGRACGEVFKIINETAREPVESPGRKSD